MASIQVRSKTGPNRPGLAEIQYPFVYIWRDIPAGNTRIVCGKHNPKQDERAGSLLGSGTAIDLGLLQIGPEDTGIRTLSCTTDPVTQILAKYNKAFQGVGKLCDFSMQIHMDSSVTPIAQPPRRIPFVIRGKVDDKIRELEQLDIIKRVEGLTPWVSPLVATPKPNGEVRVCIDMRQ